MAAKKTSSRDYHRSGFLVRIPEVYREKLKELKRKTDRPFAASVRRALDDYLGKHGVSPVSST